MSTKPVGMAFKPKCRKLIVASDFTCFTNNGVAHHFVNEFTFLMMTIVYVQYGIRLLELML